MSCAFPLSSQPADPDDDSGVVVQPKRKSHGRRNSYQEMTESVSLSPLHDMLKFPCFNVSSFYYIVAQKWD